MDCTDFLWAQTRPVLSGVSHRRGEGLTGTYPLPLTINLLAIKRVWKQEITIFNCIPSAEPTRIFFFKNIIIYFMYMSHYLCLRTHQKRTSDPVTEGCEPPCGCWDLWKSSQCSLTAEPSLQPRKDVLLYDKSPRVMTMWRGSHSAEGCLGREPLRLLWSIRKAASKRFICISNKLPVYLPACRWGT